MFPEPLSFFRAELARLDLILHRQILRLRARYQLSLDEFRGLYISDDQVDRLIDGLAAADGTDLGVVELTQRIEAARRHNAANMPPDLPWRRLVEKFQLSPFEQEVLLLTLAPEIDLKYETLYAYLNNDVSRKGPTCDLTLRLFSHHPAELQAHRCSLLPEAALFASGLLRALPPLPDRPSGLAAGLSLEPAASHYLLGLPSLPTSLVPWVTRSLPTSRWEEVPVAGELKDSLRRAVGLLQANPAPGPPPIFIFEGRWGSGRRDTARAVCRDLGVPLLTLDLVAAAARPEPLAPLLKSLVVLARLEDAGLYLEPGEALFDRDGSPLPESSAVLEATARCPGPVFLAGETGRRWGELTRGRRCLVFHFPEPGYLERLRLWDLHLENLGRRAGGPDLEAVADRFVLTPGQIRAAADAAVDAGFLEDQARREVPAELLFAAARTQSDQNLGNLAVKVKPMHTWDDLVLPAATLAQIKEVAGAVRHRQVIYGEWGFGLRFAGQGLKVLFAGASGTGKTMAAGVIARDLGLDLYKIDLSGVVSKYIGETEKNLDRIFQAARSSNAILFFDEADALFGKRSEVKDAHDRYANIEVAYLLQKLEEHEGAVILASNLSRNLDQAFSRRMHYVVEFPLPDEALRERLWRGMFPSPAPLGDDVDFPFLAKQFSLAGGDIHNVVLHAAFLAAQDGRLVTMKELVRAMARQMLKQGRIPSPADFKQYHALLAQGGMTERAAHGG